MSKVWQRLKQHATTQLGGRTTQAHRKAPARFIARQIPRAPEDLASEFQKAKHTLTGINKSQEHVNTNPEPYMEKGKDVGATQQMDQTVPKWYANAWMEMFDSGREERILITANIPTSWDRDKFEPYSLVRNRIDDEDLDWLLSDDVRNQSIDKLVEHTKLERSALEDILATVELPKKQYRNYQGKLKKAIEDTNTFLEERKQQVNMAREDDLLREIGYTDKEIDDDRQYRTNRPRGVKTLDDLGASIREKKRGSRAAQHSDMQDMLEQRRLEAIEAGEYQHTEEELERDVEQLDFVGHGNLKPKINKTKSIYQLDMGSNPNTLSRINWWAKRRREIPKGKDKYPVDVTPEYNQRLSQTEKELKKDMDEASDYARHMLQVQGAKYFQDPRVGHEDFLEAFRVKKRDDEMEAAKREDLFSKMPPAPGTQKPFKKPERKTGDNSTMDDLLRQRGPKDKDWGPK